MAILLEDRDRDILASITFLLQFEDSVSPGLLSRALAEEGISMTPAELGWWLRRSRAFRKRRRRSGARWFPVRPRLQRLYDQLGP